MDFRGLGNSPESGCPWCGLSPEPEATPVCPFVIGRLMCDACLPVGVRHVVKESGSSGPRPLAFDATHRLGGGAADHLGVAVGGVVTLPGKLPSANP